MLVHAFFPGDLQARPEAGLQELLRAILVRTNFVPVVRHIIGWRGLKQSVAAVECWTAKIQGMDGVFGLAFDGLNPCSGWVRGRFRLYYFPHPNEELVEGCAMQAAALTQAQDFLQRVRHFADQPEFSDLFRIGEFSLSVADSGQALGLTLEAPSRLRCLSEGGVSLPLDGELVQLVAPGGYDQDFPAFAVAAAFFDVLAASVTFNLGQAPVYLGEQRWAGVQLVCDPEGAVRRVETDELWNSQIILGWGIGSAGDLAASGIGVRGIHRWVPGEPIPEAFRDRLWWRADHLQGASTIDKRTLGVDERPPLLLLTGFLGAGKTSFLKHFIEHQTQRSRFVAVIQNEVGAVGLDGKLLDYTVTEVDEGCVCCSLAGNLKRAIQGILSAFDPDFIIVETTGLANPFNLLPDIKELDDLVRFDCTVTVVDALNIETTLAQHSLAEAQIRGADVLMLNKKEQVEPQRLESITRQLRQINPRAPLFLTTHGDLNPALVFEVADHQTQSLIEGQADPHHDSHHQDGLWVQNIGLTQSLDRSDFLQAVAQLPPPIFRVKGVLAFSDSPQPMLFQFVGGRFELSPFPGKDPRERFLTVIGHGQKSPEIVAALGRMTSSPSR
jgi:G3E family GTPase